MTVFILSITGGGVRGALTSRFLGNLEKNMSLYDKFHMFGGSSTGAFITAGIVYEKLLAKDICDNLYVEAVSRSIMNKSWADIILGVFQTRPKYDGTGKRLVIDTMVEKKQYNDTEKYVIIPVYDITIEKPVFCRSWEQNEYTLANVLDATSAAPSYFPSVEYFPGRWGIDGAVSSDNPALELYLSALSLFPNEKDIRILSVGTGYGKPKDVGKRSTKWGGIQWITEGNLLYTSIKSNANVSKLNLENLTYINGHRYIHVDTELEVASMDDTSEKYLDYLKLEGDKMWKKYRTDVLEILNEN